jgi:hypothetical protein
MALSVSCACGAEFEVADLFAGQAVTCPDCHQAVRVAPPDRGPPRTSGYAVASVVLALVGAFTVLFTLLAVLCGVLALVSIGRHRDRVVGVGFAAFGIVAGLCFTGLSLFAYSTGELFGVGEQVREGLWGDEINRGGPLEVVREPERFAITRPSARWGVARPEMVDRLNLDGELVLANLRLDAYVSVMVQPLPRGQSLDQCREEVLRPFRDAGNAGPAGRRNFAPRLSGFKLRDNRRLPSADGADRAEVVFEVRVAGQLLDYVAHVVRPQRGDSYYVIHGWAQRRRFAQAEPDLRKALASFRLLP